MVSLRQSYAAAPTGIKRKGVLKASLRGVNVVLVPNHLQIEDGAAEDLVRLNVRIPRWLKAAIAEAMAAPGKSLNDWVRDALRAALPKELRDTNGGARRNRERRRISPAR
jgi:hypothetical protein